MVEIKGGLILFLFALPLVIAVLRGHRNWLAIAMLLVITAGMVVWTASSGSLIIAGLGTLLSCLPWLIALVWSCTSNTRRAMRRNVQHVRIEPY